LHFFFINIHTCNISRIVREILLFCFFIFFVFSAYSQDYQYDKDLPSKEFHQKRREALRQLLPDRSAAIFFSAGNTTRSNDVDYPFHQDPDFYYLTGCLEPESMVLIFKEKQKIGTQWLDEIIFISEKNPTKEIWTGSVLGINGTKSFLGFEMPLLNTDFKDLNLPFSHFKAVCYLGGNESNPSKTSKNNSLWDIFLQKNASAQNLDGKILENLMAKLREIKQVEELNLTRKAIEITNQAHLSLMRSLRPGMTEYQAQAQVEFVFKKSGCESAAFPSIIGSGKNSCTLHYETNRKPMTAGELLVVDIGGEYHGYAADITRTLPVSGKFSAEQKQIYELVLAAQEAGIKACLAGNNFGEPGKQAKNIIAKGLLDLGIIKDLSDYTTYFMHGTSHYLGLDVHDLGTYSKLAPGNIITVEPGIYIPEDSACDSKWWNIGVRIEDDVLITSKEPENLSVKAPRTVDQIEKIRMPTAPLK